MIYPTTYERPLEPKEPEAEDWLNPSQETLREYAEERFPEFVRYILLYDKSLLLDFAMQHKRDFKEFVEG